MRYRTQEGVVIEGETSPDIVRLLREASWNEQNLSDRAYMEAVADRLYEQGVPVSTVPRHFRCWAVERRATHARNRRHAVGCGEEGRHLRRPQSANRMRNLNKLSRKDRGDRWVFAPCEHALVRARSCLRGRISEQRSRNRLRAPSGADARQMNVLIVFRRLVGSK